jgi:dihydroorotate dehydrogenase (fumarate)
MFHVGTEAYLDHIRKAKAMVDVPIIASLNGTTLGGWVDYARQMEQAGADAIELNIYWIPTDMDMSGADVEQAYLDIVNAVRAAVEIPLAVKLSPYFSNTGQHGQAPLPGRVPRVWCCSTASTSPTLILKELEVQPNLILSSSQRPAPAPELDCPAVWSGGCSLAATTGINLRRGCDQNADGRGRRDHAGRHPAAPRHRPHQDIEDELIRWLQEHEYESLDQLRGSMSQQNSPNPSEFERVQYMRGHPVLPSPVARGRAADALVQHGVSLPAVSWGGGASYPV